MRNRQANSSAVHLFYAGHEKLIDDSDTGFGFARVRIPQPQPGTPPLQSSAGYCKHIKNFSLRSGVLNARLSATLRNFPPPRCCLIVATSPSRSRRQGERGQRPVTGHRWTVYQCSMNGRSLIHRLSYSLKNKRAVGVPVILWSLNYGRWTMVVELWSLDYGRWTMGAGLWALDYGRWAMGAGLWALGYGRWTMGVADSPRGRSLSLSPEPGISPLSPEPPHPPLKK